MKAALFAILMLSSVMAQADWVCQPRYIENWPHNPYLTITELSNSQYEVLIQRSYYGYPLVETIISQAQEQRDGSFLFGNQDDKSQLSLFPKKGSAKEFPALLVSQKYGQRELICGQK
jgi:hypothetical protein